MRSVIVILMMMNVLVGCGGEKRTSVMTPTENPNPITVPLSGAIEALSGLTPNDVAIVVNLNDAQSVEVAAYYQSVRGIPAANVISIRMPTGRSMITAAEFAPIKSAVDAATPSSVQAYALTWTAPYRVECMGMTSAFAFGYAPKWCNTGGTGCVVTAPSPYFNSKSARPYDDFKIRPAMSLVGVNVANVKALIDRGARSDFTRPKGQAYLVRSSDVARSARFRDFLLFDSAWKDIPEMTVTYLDQSLTGSGYISGKADVMVYMASLASVPQIASNTYLPGAVADHLTSYGGRLTDSSQMSVLRWLEAGATASYGTVVEPCNLTDKFPKADILVTKYQGGESLIEAYWKSVRTPGEGIFVGDPLARPYVNLK